MKVFKKQDYGTINFGSTYYGRNWNDPKVDKNWLEYVVSDKCLASKENKEIARKVLIQKRVVDGQIEMF